MSKKNCNNSKIKETVVKNSILKSQIWKNLFLFWISLSNSLLWLKIKRIIRIALNLIKKRNLAIKKINLLTTNIYVLLIIMMKKWEKVCRKWNQLKDNLFQLNKWYIKLNLTKRFSNSLKLWKKFLESFSNKFIF